MKKENNESPELNKISVISMLLNKLVNQLENLFIEGLKKKGFEFENKIKLENFIKERCKKEDYVEFKKHIYYVDDIPFFVHYYEIDISPITEDNNGIHITAHYGRFAFI